MADLVSVKEISINKQVLSGSLSLNYGDAPKQFLNPNGIAQDINLQVSPPKATSFLILNIGSIGTLEVKVNSVLIKSVEASAAVSVVYDGFQWQIIETGGGANLQELTTKGQLITVNDAENLVALDIGSNNQVLTVNPTTPTGLEWANTQVSYQVFKNTITTNYTISSSDHGLWISANGQFSVFLDTSPPAGFQCVLHNVGTQTITLTTNATTLISKGTKLLSLGSVCTLIKKDITTWYAVGELAP